MSGPLALVGGAEFGPGNEATDRRLVEAAKAGPAFVLPTAAARQAPDHAVANARRWFARWGLDVAELPVLKRGDARSAELAAMAREGRFFYLVGGDPGLVVDVLYDSPVWDAIVGAWRGGAALAGSSAGAMALGEWTLVVARWPDHRHRRFVRALGVVPRLAVVPHYAGAGRRWELEPPADAVVLGIDEATSVYWDGERWLALGPGSVHVNGQTFTEGQVVEGLPRPLVGSSHP
jgi:cyanophycinase